MQNSEQISQLINHLTIKDDEPCVYECSIYLCNYFIVDIENSIYVNNKNKKALINNINNNKLEIRIT